MSAPTRIEPDQEVKPTPPSRTGPEFNGCGCLQVCRDRAERNRPAAEIDTWPRLGPHRPVDSASLDPITPLGESRLNVQAAPCDDLEHHNQDRRDENTASERSG